MKKIIMVSNGCSETCKQFKSNFEQDIKKSTVQFEEAVYPQDQEAKELVRRYNIDSVPAFILRDNKQETLLSTHNVIRLLLENQR